MDKNESLLVMNEIHPDIKKYWEDKGAVFFPTSFDFVHQWVKYNGANFIMAVIATNFNSEIKYFVNLGDYGRYKKPVSEVEMLGVVRGLIWCL